MPTTGVAQETCAVNNLGFIRIYGLYNFKLAVTSNLLFLYHFIKTHVNLIPQAYTYASERNILYQ